MTHSFPTRRSSDLFEQCFLAIARIGLHERPQAVHDLFDGLQEFRLMGVADLHGRDECVRSRVSQWCPHNKAQDDRRTPKRGKERSEEHTSELQSLMRISYAGFCLKKKK